jgi:ankyrin repeat protein
MHFKLLFASIFVLIGQEINGQSTTVSDVISKDNILLFKKYCSIDNYQKAFHRSAQLGSLNIAEYLIEQGVPINEKDSTGTTALISAVKNGHPEIVQLLLAKGADPNIQEDGGLKATALMQAASSNNVSITSNLINRGANVDATDVNGDTAINWATFNGNVDVMKLLVQNGVDLEIKSKHGMPVDVAFRLWHADSVAEVFKEAGFGDRLAKEEMKLILAIENEDIQSIKRILSKGTSPNMVDELGSPLLHLASEKGNQKVVELLFAEGADLNKLNRVGQSALAIAARFGHLYLVQYFLDKGAAPNLAGEEYKLTPLMGAAVNGDVQIGKKLISGGANLNAMDVVNEASALHWSMFYRNEEFALMLIDHGASYKIKALNNQYDGRELALLYGYDRIVEKIDSEENYMIGSWTIREIHYIYADTTYESKMISPGRLIVASNSYAIMYNPYGNKRKSPLAMSNMSDEEKVYSFNTMVFNSGKYELMDSTFISTADMAKVAGFEGGIQYYEIGSDAGRKSLTMYDETYPNGNKPEWYGKLKIKFILEKEE